MGIQFEEYLREIKSELSQEKEIEAMERKESKRRLLEHETMYGAGKTLTPLAANLTRTPNKSRRLDSKSRLQTPGSVKRLDKLGTSASKRVILTNENQFESLNKFRFYIHLIIYNKHFFASSLALL